MIRDDRIAPGAPVYHETHATAPLLKRISWSAILAGVVLAMVVSLLLNLLGTAIGSASIDPMQEANPLSGIGTGAGIWVVVSSVISLFVGGWAAGRLAQREGAFHGLLVWATVSLITVYLVSSAVTGVVRGGLNLAGSGMSALGSGIAQVARQWAARFRTNCVRKASTSTWTIFKVKSKPPCVRPAKPS